MKSGTVRNALEQQIYLLGLGHAVTTCSDSLLLLITKSLACLLMSDTPTTS